MCVVSVVCVCACVLWALLSCATYSVWGASPGSSSYRRWPSYVGHTLTPKTVWYRYKAALHADPFCYEALEQLLENHMCVLFHGPHPSAIPLLSCDKRDLTSLICLESRRLTCEEEHALLDALPFEEEFEWLHLLYRCALALLTPQQATGCEERGVVFCRAVVCVTLSHESHTHTHTHHLWVSTVEMRTAVRRRSTTRPSQS